MRHCYRQDVEGGHPRHRYGGPGRHGRHGYGYLPAVVLPALRAAGVGEDALRQVLVDNPARILTVP